MKLKIPNRKKLENEYRNKSSFYEKILENLRYKLKKELKQIKIYPTIRVRVKSFDTYYQKYLRLLKKYENEEEAFFIYDVLGIRIVCPFLDDIIIVENLIKKKYHVFEVERKGKQHSFKEFGYNAIHFLINVPKDILNKFQITESLVCEIQLCTILQDAWSEVEHELVYKSDFSPFAEPLKRKLAALNAILTLSDTLFQEIRDYQRNLQQELKKRRELFYNKIYTVEDETNIDLIPVIEGTVMESEISQDHKNEGDYIKVEKNIDDLLMEALIAHNNQQFKNAITIYSEILKAEPQDSIKLMLHIHKGMAYFAESEYPEAIKNFTEALELNRNDPKAYHYRGLTYQILNDYKSALNDFNRCLKLNPFHFETLYNRAVIWFYLGNYPEALSDCEQALNIEPESLRAKNFRKIINANIKL